MRDSLRQNGIDAPNSLTSDGVGYEFWQNPDLVLSQTCGYPYRSVLREKVNLVGTPDYGLEGCPAGYYHSVFIVRADSQVKDIRDLAGARMAYNDTHSQSGFHGPRAFAEKQGIELSFDVETGAHRASALAVYEGRAATAALDAVTWRNLVRFEEFASALRVVARTWPVPGLPLICARRFEASIIAEAFEKGFTQLRADFKQYLGIVGFVRMQPEDYSSAAFLR